MKRWLQRDEEISSRLFGCGEAANKQTADLFGMCIGLISWQEIWACPEHREA
jgi:hypothetical protein